MGSEWRWSEAERQAILAEKAVVAWDQGVGRITAGTSWLLFENDHHFVRLRGTRELAWFAGFLDGAIRNSWPISPYITLLPVKNTFKGKPVALTLDKDDDELGELLIGGGRFAIAATELADLLGYLKQLLLLPRLERMGGDGENCIITPGRQLMLFFPERKQRFRLDQSTASELRAALLLAAADCCDMRSRPVKWGKKQILFWSGSSFDWPQLQFGGRGERFNLKQSDMLLLAIRLGLALDGTL